MIRFEAATEADDKELRALLRDNDMPSWVNMSLQREPSFFAGMNQVTRDYAVIARDDGQAIGMYTCSQQSVHFNGDSCTLGYLGGLRVIPSHRNRIRILRDGYASIARLVAAGSLPFWFTSVARGNSPARRLLEAGLPGMPRYYPANELFTFALPVSQGRRINLWRQATEADIPGMIDFHNREASKFQFATVLSEAWIRHIGLQHFLVYGEQDIRACLAIWNQSAFKQVIAKSYRPPLQAIRPLYNAFATMARRVRLPAIGQPFSQTFLAFATFADSAMPLAVELLRDALSQCSSEAAIIALHDRHPLMAELARFKPFVYRTRIYAVSFADAPAMDGRPAQPEAALL
ncbi:MAG TPA: hypothetical protein VKA31_11010 [Mariprofundaceae bacterium]|nr:hypothetical protein [Mariprofundaceae bacterium]